MSLDRDPSSLKIGKNRDGKLIETVIQGVKEINDDMYSQIHRSLTEIQ